MTNFEFYKDELMAIAGDGSDVALVKGKPAKCTETMCEQCKFGSYNCGADLVKWLYAEHVEKPKIDKRTKMFFDAIETGWVARDKDSQLTIYSRKPNKSLTLWTNAERGGEWFIISGCYIYDFLVSDLGFIKWEDEEPWRVEDIRNLEVV